MSAPQPQPRLFHWHDGVDAFVPVPASADSPALRELLDFDGLEHGGEVVARFKRVDLTDAGLEELLEA